jgi:23S rRNA (uracil1939-C5)-methyltransferase
MSNQLPEEEINYRQRKQQYLTNIFQSFNFPIDFKWVGNSSRRRVTFQVLNNNLGFFHEKTHNLISLESYDLAVLPINSLIPELKKLLKQICEKSIKQIIVTNFDNGLDVIFKVDKKISSAQEIKLIQFAKSHNLVLSLQINSIIFPLFLPRQNQLHCGSNKIAVSSDIFIQATKIGLDYIVDFLRTTLDKNHAKKIADLYCGCGVYSFSLTNATRRFDCFEGSESMIEIIKNNQKNLENQSNIKAILRDLFVDPLNVKELNSYDNIIINPPRNGAEPQILNLAESQVKNIQYVSCNPQTLVRDAKILVDENYNITNIIAIDQFYSTKHHEVIISFTKK